MAGSYPDVPAPRMAYDRDGSIGFWHFNSTPTVLTDPQMANMNDEVFDAVTNPGGSGDPGETPYVGIIFPELRDIAAVGFVQGSNGNTTIVETSGDTTNGLDGTWTEQIDDMDNYPTAGAFRPDPPYYRTTMVLLSVAGVKAIRFVRSNLGGDKSIHGMHLYGDITAGETPDRLRLWHPTLDQALDDTAVSPDGAYFDWGNVQQTTTQDRMFRIKNNSATLTATDITLSTEALTPAAVPDAHTINSGSGFGATANIASLAPGVISSVCTLRRTTPSNATLGPWAVRIIAEADSWA